MPEKKKPVGTVSPLVLAFERALKNGEPLPSDVHDKNEKPVASKP